MKNKTNLKSNIIMLVGFPRSGTTWFSNLINAHSQVSYRHELIGRNYYLFGERLFKALKKENGLSDSDFNKAIEVIKSASVDSDKPPFFRKKFGLHKFPRFHYLCWLTVKFVPFLNSLYNAMFKLENKHEWQVLLKETRSLKDMESMVNGLRIEKLLFLIRVPHGAISSHLNGVKKGAMQRVSIEDKKVMLEKMRESEYLREWLYEKNDLDELSDIAYYAASWTLYHENLLRLREIFSNSTVCFYDKFVDTPLGYSKSLVNKIGLGFDEATEQFIDSSSGKDKRVLKDAGDEYFSVYRKDSFDKDAWKKNLTSQEIKIVDSLAMPLYEKLYAVYGDDLILKTEEKKS